MRPPGSLPTLRGCAGPIAVRQTSRARAQVHVADPTVRRRCCGGARYFEENHTSCLTHVDTTARFGAGATSTVWLAVMSGAALESRSLLLLLFEEVREHDRLQRHHHLVEEHQAEDLPADAPREARPQRRDPALLYYVLQAEEEVVRRRRWWKRRRARRRLRRALRWRSCVYVWRRKRRWRGRRRGRLQ